MIPVEPIRKPSNATWTARVVIDPKLKQVRAARAGSEAPDHRFGNVDIAWYEDGVIKVAFRHAGPAVIRQAYLSGKGEDVILDIAVPCPPAGS